MPASWFAAPRRLLLPRAIRPQRVRTHSSQPGWVRRRSVGAWLGLILLTLDILAGGVLPPDPGRAFAQGLGDNHIQICTATGIVELGPDGVPVSDQAPGHRRICLFCLPVLSGALDTAPPVSALPLRSAIALPTQPPPVGAPAATPTALAGCASPRAPPLS